MPSFKFIIFGLLLLIHCIGFAQISKSSIDSLINESKSLYSNRNFNASIVLLDELELRFESMKDTEKMLSYLYEMALFFIDKRDKALSLKYLYKGLESLENTIIKKDVNKFYIYNLQGMPIFKAFENDSQRYDLAMLYCNYYNRIGGAFYTVNEFQKAKEYWYKTNQLAINNDLIGFQSTSLNNIADILNIEKNYVEAEKLYRASYQISLSSNDTPSTAFISTNLAFYFLNTLELDSAYHYLTFSDQLTPIIKNKYYKLNIYHCWAKYYRLKGQYSDAIKNAKISVSYAKEINSMHILLKVYEELSHSYEMLPLLDSAIYYTRLWNETDKTLRLQEDKRMEFEADAKFQLKQKQSEIDLMKQNALIDEFQKTLERRIVYTIVAVLVLIICFILFLYRERRQSSQKLEAQYIEIQKQNAEKETLLKEIHHRVKNNLQIITSLLSLQSGLHDNKMVTENFSYIQNRVNSMALIHEMLYRSGNFSSIDYSEYLEKLLSGLIGSFKGSQHNIHFTIDAKEIFLDIDTAVPLGLIINEIVTNSLKYAFEDDNGEIYIKISPSGNKFNFQIGDNGVGIPKDFDMNRSNSLGMLLIHNLVRQLNGNIKMDDTKPGTHFVFDVNIS